MAKQVVTLLLAARGIAETHSEADRNAASDLVTAASKVANGERPAMASVQFEEIDPGDGPCAPFKDVQILISASGLPNPDDDD